MAGKAGFKFMLATKPKNQQGNEEDPKKKKGKGNLPPALRAAVQRKIKKSGKKNGNN